MISAGRNNVSLGSKLSIFPDCTSSYWATPYIKTAVENGLMSAYNDSYFHPENLITYAEAADACLKILGYTKSDFSDWPSSQISLAESKGIAKSITKSAYDTLSKKEAIVMLYNTLCATAKNGMTKGVENIGYNYYEEAVMMATSSENSSVPTGKVLTSVGTFSIDEKSFNHSDIGKSGQLLVYSGKLLMFNAKKSSYVNTTVYSTIPGGLAVACGTGVSNLAVSDDTLVYINAAESDFDSAKVSIATGDQALVCYDNNKRIEYIYINSSSLAGPYTVTSPNGWFIQITGANESSKIMKNGSEISSSELSANDILYYSPSLDTAFAYNNKVIGILEGATPSKDAPGTVKVSGVSYTVEAAGVSFVDSQYGDTVILCLGRTGKVASAYSASGNEVTGYLAGTGMKNFTNHNDENYTSNYATLVLPDGSRIDLATNSEYDGWINRVVSANFSDGKATLTLVSSPRTLSGKVDVKNQKIGSSKISGDVKIIDVGYIENDKPTIFKSIYPQRIDGLTIASSDVLYAKSENGYITELILNDVTGDAFSYGVITSAPVSLENGGRSGSYTCDIKGVSYSYSGGIHVDIKRGNFVKTALSGNQTDCYNKLVTQSVSAENVSYTSITLKDGTVYTLSDNITVYKNTAPYEYVVLPLSDLVSNPSAYSNYKLCYDKEESQGGRVRIIVVQ